MRFDCIRGLFRCLRSLFTQAMDDFLIIAVLIIEQNAARLPPIASGTADLLDIVGHADWCIEVDDKFNIRHIDAHAEGRGRYHDLFLALQEVHLHLPFQLFRLDFRVIARYLSGIGFLQKIIDGVYVDHDRSIVSIFFNAVFECFQTAF